MSKVNPSLLPNQNECLTQKVESYSIEYQNGIWDILHDLWHAYHDSFMSHHRLTVYLKKIFKTSITVENFQKFADHWIENKTNFFTISEFLDWYKDFPQKTVFQPDGCPYRICKRINRGYVPVTGTDSNHGLIKRPLYIRCLCNSVDWKSSSKEGFINELQELDYKMYEPKKKVNDT